ncbi:MAG: glycosyltransferase family 4 protein [Nocardioidaceae bacterium]
MRRGSHRESPAPDSWHVAVVVENVPLGIDTRLAKQVDELLAAGYRVSVVTMRADTNADWRRRARVRLLEYPAAPEPTGPLGYVREFATAFGWAALHLVRLRLRGRVHVVQFCQPPDIYFPLAWLMRLGGARIVFDQRDLMPELLRARYTRSMRTVERVLALFERQTQRAAHATLTVNHFLERRIQEAGAAPERVFVVWNGPVLTRVHPRRDTEPQDGRHLVVWAGKMGRQDRVELVLDVAERVARERPRNDCRFVLLGDGECLEELRSAVVTRHLEKVVSLPGWVTEAEVFGHLASATLGLDTSLQEEVSPVKAMEYMAHGLAFVCFDLPESRALADGAAVLAPSGDIGAFTTAVLSLLDDDHRRRVLGDAGRRRIAEELAWEHQAAVYLRVMSPGWTASAS